VLIVSIVKALKGVSTQFLFKSHPELKISSGTGTFGILHITLEQ